VKVEALLLQLLDAGLNGRAVEVGPHADRHELAFGDAGGKDVPFGGTVTPKPAERVHQDCGRDACRRPLASLAWDLASTSFVDPPNPRVRTDEVVLEHCLEVRLLPYFLEEREPHLGVVELDIARAQETSCLLLAARGAQACC
jgi:hypothetical protein